MKKLVRIISAAILSVAFIGTAASAQTAIDCSDITINNSGNNSNNAVTCTTVTNVTVDCVNNIVVANVNFQGADSGNATASGSGSANSGTVVNYNGTNTTVGAACDTAASPSPSPSPSITPDVPGQGGVTPTTTTPASLPNTAGTSAEAVIFASLLSAAGIVIVSRVAVAVYRHYTAK